MPKTRLLNWEPKFILYIRLTYFDGLVESRKLDFLPQYIGYKIDKATVYCGQNKMLGLFTSSSYFSILHLSVYNSFSSRFCILFKFRGRIL